MKTTNEIKSRPSKVDTINAIRYGQPLVLKGLSVKQLLSWRSSAVKGKSFETEILDDGTFVIKRRNPITAE